AAAAAATLRPRPGPPGPHARRLCARHGRAAAGVVAARLAPVARMNDPEAAPRTFVLVHGGGHGGWCWKSTARPLRQADHEGYAPSLTGFGERFHLKESDPDVETFVTDIVGVLEYEDLNDVVLVGHSMGGVIIPRVAERVPERIRRVVWLAAVVCNDGESLLQ